MHARMHYVHTQSLSLTHTLTHTYIHTRGTRRSEREHIQKITKANHIQEDADAGPDDPMSPAKNSRQIATLRDELSHAHELLQQREDEVRASCVCVCVCVPAALHTHTHTQTDTSPLFSII